jgi:hypothetical protein
MRLRRRRRNLKGRKMKIKQIIKAIRNADQIVEGISNTIFKKEHVELIANERWKICKKCEFIDPVGDKCVAPGTQPCCGECGCSLAFKLRALSASCPKDKWTEIITDEEEDKLINRLENGN